MGTHRVERVAAQLRQEISEIIIRDLKDPRIGMATITEVKLTPDLRNATVKVSVVAEDDGRQAAVTHKDADGDTLGSALALAQALGPIGKSVPVLSSPPVPQAWWFLPGFERVNQQSASPDTPVFIFDASDASRAGTNEPIVTQAKVVVNIDHHVSNT